ncbi:MAG: hypothetical protein ABW061_00095 [Polyangiaceae bacterium]
MRRAFEILRNASFVAPWETARALAEVRATSGLDFSRARARAGFARGHLLDVVVYLPGGCGAGLETEAAEDLVRLLVGEELFERWIGHVVATPTVRGGLLTVINENSDDQAALPIGVLPETVRAALEGLKLGLSELSFEPVADAADWFAFELEPERAPDYAAQDDLLFCSTRLPELKMCHLRAERFFSGRFTNSGALFAYLKFESRELTPEGRLSERAGFEELIKRSLPSAHGGLVGLGLGLRYGYIDVALIDPDCVEVLLPALRAAQISPRSWLLFCDSELEHEYVPVHANSPAPWRGREAGR